MGKGLSKRERKKRARQENNLRAKNVPSQTATSSSKSVPQGKTSSDQYRKEKVRWSARFIDLDPIDTCDVGGRKEPWNSWNFSEQETKEFLQFVDNISDKTWQEVLEERVPSGRKSRSKHHSHKISEIEKEAQKRIRALLLFEDGQMVEEEIFRFRLSGKVRISGFRSGNRFHVLWYDRYHKVYPVEKRHT